MLKTGAAYVYLDPKLPLERKRSILTTASATHLVTGKSSPHDSWFEESFEGAVISHASAHEYNVLSDAYIQNEVQPDDLAYLIFTSGSTGTSNFPLGQGHPLKDAGEPKGVMLEHGSFANFVRCSVPIFQVGHGTRCLQIASYNFDASVLEWSTTLASGGTLCFAETPQALVGDYLADVIDKNSISFMQITPTALATIPSHRDLPSLRCVSVGGEAVPARLLEEWGKRLDIVNSYGPTETRYLHTIFEFRCRC